MSLTTRTAKGSKLTIQEMDGNLTYLESNGFVNGEYSQTLIGTGAVLSLSPQLAPDATIGKYTGISQSGGSGTGLIVNVEIFEGGKGLQATYTIVDGGSGYQVGDTVSTQNTDIGGSEGSIESSIFDDDLDVTTTSTITVTNNDITLNTTTLTVTGSINVDGVISTTSNIAANIGTFTNGVFAGNQLLVSNAFGDTIVNFGALPTTDPTFLGRLWNDSGSLKISAGD